MDCENSDQKSCPHSGCTENEVDAHDRLRRLDEIISLSSGLAYQFVLHRDGRMTVPYASQGMYDLFEVTPEELCHDATKLLAFVHPRDLGELLSSIHASAIELALWQKEFRVVTAGGRESWLYAMSVPEKGKHDEIIWNGIIIDATHLVDKYKQLLAINTVNSQAEIDKNHFIDDVAHELRTPMSILSSSNEIIHRYTNKLSSDEVAVQHENIKCATERLSELIDSIFKYCQSCSNESQNESGSSDFIEICKEVSADIVKSYQDKCRFVFDVNGDFKDVSVDAELLRKILKNILSNAFRFTKTGGDVSFLVTREKSKLLLEIKDSGIGIPQEDLDRILKPFQVGSNATGLHGLGLGLSIAHTSLIQMGGTLFFCSRVDTGTTARIEIPFVSMENSRISNSMYSILIVEDDPSLLANIEVILEMEGYTVMTAGNGVSGLAVVRDQRPDLILCDILMPEMDGHAFFEAIKAIPENEDTPFIFISALSDHANMRKGLLAGADDYLVKPFTTDELLATVSTQMRKFQATHQPKGGLDVSPEKILVLRQISKREREILILVGKGVTSKVIAEQLFISPRTVDVHRYRLMKKLGVTNAVQLAKWAEIAAKS